MKQLGIIGRFQRFMRRHFGGVALHKALERNEKASRELDAAVREVLQK